jgi:hypothetical protein
VATTVNAYVTPTVNPATVIGEAVPVAVDTAPEEVFTAKTVYSVILPPPVSEGAVKEAAPSPLPTESNVGALGTWIGS